LLFSKAKEQGIPYFKVLFKQYQRIQSLLCEEICHRADVDPRLPVSSLSEDTIQNLKKVLKEIISKIENSEFTPCIIWNGDDRQKAVDFHSLEIKQYNTVDFYPSISRVWICFIRSKILPRDLHRRRQISRKFKQLH